MINKRSFWFGCISILFLMVFGIGVTFAGQGFSPDGNERRGKYLYRKNCRSCHDGSSAKELAPNSKTQAQWESSFNSYQDLKCSEEWKGLSSERQNDIFTYLYKHAYDSDQPATCG